MDFKNLNSYLTITGILFVSTQCRPMKGQNDVINPWEKPCFRPGAYDGGSSTSIASSADNTTIVHEPLNEQLRELTIRCSEALDLVGNVTRIIFTKRIQSQMIMDQLRTKHVLGFPLPGQLESWDTSKSIKSVLEKDTAALQKITVFLQQIKNEEMMTKSLEDLTQNFTAVLEKVYSLLCQLENIETSQSYNFTTDVSNNVMPDAVQNVTSTAVRFEQDYVILRDLQDILASRKDIYRRMVTLIG